MASRDELVLEALKAMVIAALPAATVTRNPKTLRKLREGGLADLYDGEKGEPEIDLSPLTYNWTHQIPLVLTGWDSASQTAEQLLDGMKTPIGAAVAANRILGGLVTWLDVRNDGRVDAEEEAADASALQLTLIAQYSTTSPL